MCLLRSDLERIHDFGRWNGLPGVVENIAYHLDKDILSLRKFALVSRVFAIAAQKALFQELKFVDRGSVYRWQIQIAEFAFFHGRQAVPLCLRNVKLLTVSLVHIRDFLFLRFIRRIEAKLPALQSIRFIGFDELLLLPPRSNWLTSFITATGVSSISFHGILVPEYILDFALPCVRKIEFDECRIYHHAEGFKHFRWRQPTLNATLCLTGRGQKWERVESITSGAMNSEALRLIRDARVGLDTLNIRVCLNKIGTTPDEDLQANISGLRSLALCIPSWTISRMPHFLAELVPRAPYLTELGLFYEQGWSSRGEIDDWVTLVYPALRAIHSALKSKQLMRLKSITFTFYAPASFPKVLWEPVQNLCEEEHAMYISVCSTNTKPTFLSPERPSAHFGSLLLGLIDTANSMSDVATQ